MPNAEEYKRRPKIDPLAALTLIDDLQARRVNVDDLKQIQLVPVCRSIAHLTNDKKSWIVGVSVQDLKDYAKRMMAEI